MSNIPNYEQWGKMNDYLNSIALSLGSKVDVSTWEGVQRAVRLGLAPTLFPIGSQLKANHSVYGELIFDVVAHDYYKSVRDENAHTMTLMCHDSIGLMQFDAPESFYFVSTPLSPGAYNFLLPMAYMMWGAGFYQFDIPRDTHPGTPLRIVGNPIFPITNAYVVAYENMVSDVELWRSPIYAGSGGTNLDSVGLQPNSVHRAIIGSNNYKESAIRQFLNSSRGAGSVWSPQTEFDRPPTWVNSTAGFMNGLDSDFLNIVGEVIVPCAANSTYEYYDSETWVGEKYTLTDKFYLPSQMEIFGVSDDIVSDGTAQFPYYKGSNGVDRIKRTSDGKGEGWWLRSPLARTSYSVRISDPDGQLGFHNAAENNLGVVPVCTIV